MYYTTDRGDRLDISCFNALLTTETLLKLERFEKKTFIANYLKGKTELIANCLKRKG